MIKFRLFWACALLVMASACASSVFPRTTYPSADEPSTVRAYSDFMVARVAALTHDPDEAARRYAAAIGTAPASLGVAERAVLSSLLAGDFGLAAGAARRAKEAGSTTGLVRLTLASDAIVRGRLQTAGGYIDGDDLGGFNGVVARNVRAWTLLGSGDAASAEALVRQNLTGDARLDNATLHLLGLMQLAARKDDAAAETFEGLWASGARLAIGVEAYAELLASRGERDRAVALLDAFRTEVGYNAALAALAARLENGEAVPPRRLTTRQGAALAVFLPASALVSQTTDDAAAVYFVLAVALDPGLDPARLAWAQVLVQGERTEDALRVLDEVRSASPFFAAARGQMARALMRDDRAEEALQIAAEASPETWERPLQMQLADLYRSLEQDAQSETILARIIEADAAEDKPDWRVFFLRGAARGRQADWTGAEADMQRALELDPDNAAVLNFLGYSWIDRGIKLDEGMAMIRKAVALQPESGAIIDSLGWAHYRLGEFEEAVDVLERAVTLLPGDPLLNDHLGDAYWQTGRRKEAGFQWRRVLKLDPSAEDRARIERKLLDGPEPVRQAAPVR